MVRPAHTHSAIQQEEREHEAATAFSEDAGPDYNDYDAVNR